MCDSIRWSNGLPYKRRGRKDINVKRDNDYVCPQCKKVFSRKYNMKRHANMCKEVVSVSHEEVRRSHIQDTGHDYTTSKLDFKQIAIQSDLPTRSDSINESEQTACTGDTAETQNHEVICDMDLLVDNRGEAEILEENIDGAATDEESLDQPELDEVEGDFSPFPSYKFALLYFLIYGGRYVLSRDFREALWWVLKQLGVTGIPTLNSLRNFESQLPKARTIECRNTTGKLFYVNSITDTIRLALANPAVSSSLARIPEVKSENVSRLSQSFKWLNNPTFLTPMVKLPAGDIFLGDIVKIRIPVGEDNFHYGQVTKFYFKDDVLQFRYNLLLSKKNIPHVQILHHQELIYVENSDLEAQSTAIEHRVLVVPVERFCPQSHTTQLFIRRMYKTSDDGSVGVRPLSAAAINSLTNPSSLRSKAAGRSVVMVPLLLWSDETSGNTTKQWNLFENWFLALAGLPLRDIQCLKNLHFVATSNVVNALEISEAIAQEITDELQDGIECFDAVTKNKVLVVGGLFATLADNKRASELVNHAGATANCYCRFCFIDKRQQNPLDVTAERRSNQRVDEIVDRMTDMTRSAYQNERAATGVNKTFSPLTQLPGYDRDSLIECLHTFCLGPAKHETQLVKSLDNSKLQTIRCFVDAFDFTDFPSKMTGRHLTDYSGSFVGRDFKLFVQIAPFVLQHVYPADSVRRVVYLAEVCKALYVSVIDNEEIYKETLQSYINRYLQKCVETIPQYAKERSKYHMLLHCAEQVEKFGLLLFGNTERFESMNGIVRDLIQHTDRKVPSRDVARKFASQQFASHLFDGGYFSFDGVNFHSVGCGIQLLKQEPPLQKLIFGSVTRQNGVRFAPKCSDWESSSRQGFLGRTMDDNVVIHKYKAVTNSKGKLQRVGSSVDCEEYFARIQEIYQIDNSVIVVVRKYTLVNEVDSLGCQKYELETNYKLLNPERIINGVSMVHDCSQGNCGLEMDIAEVQTERRVTTEAKRVWKHADDQYFVINRFRFGELEELWDFEDN
ncbi:hypothetical protein BKA69DRAFT_1036324 [Paraphysoderma sedebokerense]|nr:hypothetical protein BKA69DRAFT_1036324 [Paraphysoderma sedebokerense]